MTNVQSNISITAEQYAVRPVTTPQTADDFWKLSYREQLWLRQHRPMTVERLLNKT